MCWSFFNAFWGILLGQRLHESSISLYVTPNTTYVISVSVPVGWPSFLGSHFHGIKMTCGSGWPTRRSLPKPEWQMLRFWGTQTWQRQSRRGKKLTYLGIKLIGLVHGLWRHEEEKGIKNESLMSSLNTRGSLCIIKVKMNSLRTCCFWRHRKKPESTTHQALVYLAILISFPDASFCTPCNIFDDKM